MKNRDRCMGAYFGAAIGDAMGGPVEGRSYQEIRGYFPDGVQTLMPYAKPYSWIPLQSGYALHGDAGSITDDTYIRKDFSRFFIENAKPWTANKLADWLVSNVDFKQWWPVVVGVLYDIKGRQKDPKTSGLTHVQGGGIGWWTPVGIVHAGDPDQAAFLARELCTIWKAPLEQDFCAAFCAGLATAVSDGTTWEKVLEAMLHYGGPLSTKLIDRAANVAASETGDIWALADHLYHNVVITSELTQKSDGLMPEGATGDNLSMKGSILWAEQIPLAVAAMVYGKGKPDSIPICVNIGRDCDTTATTVGGLVGGLVGESGLPAEWVGAVEQANKNEIDFRTLSDRLIQQ